MISTFLTIEIATTKITFSGIFDLAGPLFTISLVLAIYNCYSVYEDWKGR